MKFIRTVKVTRTRRELVVPVATRPERCPHCGGDLRPPLVPGMPLRLESEPVAAIPSEEKK